MFNVPDGGSPASINVTDIGPQPYPATEPWLATAPVHFGPCTLNSTFGSNSLTASWNLYVVNGRSDITVGLFSGGTDTPQLEAWSSVVTTNDKLSYMHPHLARAAVEDAMFVVFQSKLNSETAGVRYGLNATSLTSFAAAESYTYSAADLCPEGGIASSFGWHDPGYFHRALMTGLPTDGQTTVYYQVGDDTYGWSDVFSFTATVGANPDATVNLILVADMGVSLPDNTSMHWLEPDAYQTAAGMLSLVNQGYTMVLHSGDLSYATGYEAKWDHWLTQMDPVMSRVPYMVSMGNHERDSDAPNGATHYKSRDSGGECGVPTMSRFAVPRDVLDQGLDFYSYNVGPVHVTMWDTELECGPGSEQYAFLESDLSSVNRTLTPWVVVFGHRPIYTGNDRDSYLGQIEPLLFQYNASMSLYGHVHNAQLWCPIFNGTCIRPGSPEGQWVGPVHAVIGNAGMGLSAFPAHLDDRTVYAAEEYGYSSLTANRTHLTFRFFTDSTGELHYQFTMFQ